MKSTLRNIILIGLLLSANAVSAQNPSYISSLDAPNKWVDSVFRKLNRNERIAQMLFVRAHTNLSKAYQDSVGKVIKKEHLGGVVFFQGGPGRQIALSNTYQSYSRVPLLIASDGEWGLGMRLDSTVAFPYQMTLGAIQNDQLLYRMGMEVAKHFKRVGMHMNLAPVADVNNNPKNPVINFRSFGEDKNNVSKKTRAYMRGMQDGGLLVSLKHFPGHGDTDVDSHYDLPLLSFTASRLDSLELYPFKQLINEGTAGVMIAHMNIPSLDNTPNLPSTLSRPIVTGLLREKLGFKGLVITDAMDMKGVVKYFKDGDAEVKAVHAGNDILELAENTKVAVAKIRKALRQGKIEWSQVDSSVRRILHAKYWAGLNKFTPPSELNVVPEINDLASAELIKQLSNAAVTILRGRMVIENLDPAKRTVLLSIGNNTKTTFQTEAAGYFGNSLQLNLDQRATANDIARIISQIGADDQLLISIHDNRSRPGNNLPLSKDILQLISEMHKRAIITLFANPYNLSVMQGIDQSKGLIVAYQKEDFMQRAVVEVLKKQVNANGKLPVSVAPYFKFGEGL